MNSFQNTIMEMKNSARANKLNQSIIFLRGLIFLIFITFLGLSSTTCGSAKNYLSPEGPKYTVPYAQNQFDFDNSIKVISFNIKLSKNIDRAIYELKHYPELKYADLILLQEMDELGTDKIAKILKYNYIYYPASIHPKSDRNFGNAILSKWPIINDQKIILPHEVAIRKTRRIAVSATVLMDRLKLRVYSVHTETMILSKEKRMNQVNSVLKSISDHPEHIIIGGDFNTTFLHNIRDIETLFDEYGFIRASKNAGPTVDKGPIEMTLDHIFAKGFQVIETGTIKTKASDHQPIWAVLKPILPEKSHL